MTDYEALVAEGDRFRVEQYQPDEAIEKYNQALVIGGSKDRHCRQMLGVCYQLKHEYSTAIEWYRQAEEGADSYELGNILRDMAESESGLGQYEAALALLGKSLDSLPISQHPDAHAATQGFIARTYQRRGEIGQAVKFYAIADVILSHGGNRHTELYNKLHYANALSQNGQWSRDRLVALKAFKLSLKFGANPHRVRAVMLLLGGYKLDNYFRAKRHK